VKDFQIVRITEEIVELFNFQNEPQPLEIKEIKGNVEKEQKPSFKHFMLKEIFEQPSVVQKILQHPPSFAQFSQKPQRIIIIACGTASYAGFIGKYILEKITKIPVINEIASEFRYKEPLLTSSDLVMAISQSGETADTLAAVRLAKNLRIRTLGIINVANSSIASEVDDVIYTEAGSEIGVASTKAFLAQVTVLYQLAYSFSHQNFFPSALAQTMEKMLSLNEEIRKIALKYCLFQNFLYLGRNVNYPLALEGALKLKEISYLHAEAYPAGELKHGPIALISEQMPTLAICPEDEVYSKMLNNIEEIKADSACELISFFPLQFYNAHVSWRPFFLLSRIADILQIVEIGMGKRSVEHLPRDIRSQNRPGSLQPFLAILFAHRRVHPLAKCLAHRLDGGWIVQRGFLAGGCLF